MIHSAAFAAATDKKPPPTPTPTPRDPCRTTVVARYLEFALQLLREFSALLAAAGRPSNPLPRARAGTRERSRSSPDR